MDLEKEKMKKEEVQEKNKKVMIVAAVTICLLVLIVGISYAYWQITKVQEDTNIISSGCFGVSLSGNEAINLANSYPMTEEDGMKTTPYTFTITNTCGGDASYIVNLESLSNTTFNNTSIRVAIDNTNKLYSEYSESNKYYSSSKEARTLVSGTLRSNESVTYNLRMWIDERADTSEQNKIFASKIVVTSGQEGEVEESSITNINATSTTDSISITYNANGETTCKYGIEEGAYDNIAANVTNKNCNIEGLSENTTYYYQICTETGKGSKCEVGSVKTQYAPKSMSEVELGDYINMIPTSTSYTPSGSDTGCLNDSNCTQNTINPSELNLWRVIKKNEDGTVEVVSEYVSSAQVNFYGQTGYMNYVGALNTIAAQYTNEKYVLKTRHMGYSNQKEKCTGVLGYTDSTACPGDTGYETDTNLVTTALGRIGTDGLDPSSSGYWLSSRYFRGYAHYDPRWVNTEIRDIGKTLYSVFNNGSPSVNNSGGAGIRPILTLKSDNMIINGDGESADTAYSFE